MVRYHSEVGSVGVYEDDLAHLLGLPGVPDTRRHDSTIRGHSGAADSAVIGTTIEQNWPDAIPVDETQLRHTKWSVDESPALVKETVSWENAEPPTNS